MTVDKSLPGCTCPPCHDYCVSEECRVHHGDGWGYCHACAKERNEVRASYGIEQLCASCLIARRGLSSLAIEPGRYRTAGGAN